MNDESPGTPGRRTGQAVLVVLAIAAVVLSASLVPALQGVSGIDTGNPAVPAAKPGSSVDGLANGINEFANAESGSGQGFGAMNQGQVTSVGGAESPDANQFRNQSTAVHFYARSDEPHYWRTDAYAEYTGQQWHRDPDANAYDGAIPVNEDVDVRRVSATIELRRGAANLPTIWQPERLASSSFGDDDLGVTETRSVEAAAALPAGTTYRLVSAAPEPNETVLRTAGGRYPGDVVDTYTQLPDDLSPRVEAKTEDVVRGADSAYAAATRIETWLESNRAYSLEATHDPSAHGPAEAMLFEMDAGYCEYFATTMTVMLRSQGIPARYVVGYSPGTPTDDGRYAVRAMNAHAWVEVYFPDVGWIRFDPTPASARRQAELARLDDETDLATTTGSPNESGGFLRDVPGPYDIELNETAVPGQRVTATVTKRGVPVAGLAVSANGESVGVTDERGTVNLTVPYVHDLTIEVDRTSDRTTARLVGVPPPDHPTDDRRFALRRASPSPHALSSSPENGTNGSSKTVHVQGDLSMTVISGDPASGSNVTLAVTVDGHPVRGASVSVAGEPVGRTTPNGTIVVRVPSTSAPTTVVSARRGEFTVNRSLATSELSVRTRPGTLVALPGQNATLVVTAGDEPVEGAVVTRNGVPLGTTDATGRLTVRLPWTNAVTYSVSVFGTESSVTASNVLVHAGLLASLGVGLLVGVAVGLRRRGVTASFVARTVAGVITRVLDGVVAVLVDLAQRTDALDGPRSTVTRLVERVRSAWWTAIHWVEQSLLRRTDEPGGTSEISSGRHLDESRPAEREDVRRAWRTLVEGTRVRGWRQKTPGEIGRHAVEAGFSEPAVRTLTDAFRDVEYGERDPTNYDRRATDAARTISGSSDGSGPSGDEDRVPTRPSDSETAGDSR